MRHDGESRFGWHRVVCLAVAQEIFLSVSWTSSAVSLGVSRGIVACALTIPARSFFSEHMGAFPKTEQQDKTRNESALPLIKVRAGGGLV